ncbi:hypothetical protein GCM10023086_74810 [Streptomyces venetus]|uniref:Uncharacterized protein n=1 Tax=Streptomyces venetus TaxID=1701086 RepID=A0ABP8HI65_9ACTN
MDAAPEDLARAAALRAALIEQGRTRYPELVTEVGEEPTPTTASAS